MDTTRYEESVSNKVIDHPSHEDRFKINLSDLFKLLQKLARGHEGIKTSSFSVIRAIIDSFDSRELISSFIEKSYNYWDLIYKRDINFIGEKCNDVFSDLSAEDHSIFCNITSVISENDTDMIWDYFDSFVKISIKYIHFRRKPKIKDIGRGNGPEKVYSKGLYPQVKLKEYSKVWKVKLQW